MYIITLYTSNYYEDKYLTSLLAHFKHRAKAYAHNFTHFIFTTPA